MNGRRLFSFFIHMNYLHFAWFNDMKLLDVLDFFFRIDLTGVNSNLGHTTRRRHKHMNYLWSIIYHYIFSIFNAKFCYQFFFLKTHTHFFPGKQRIKFPFRKYTRIWTQEYNYPYTYKPNKYYEIWKFSIHFTNWTPTYTHFLL